MIRTKQQADSHVSAVLKPLKTDREKLLRGYQFARLYFDIKEYDIAKRHLTGFLSVKDNSAQAHKLLAQILECQHETGRAADAYRRSLELDPLQYDVLLRIGELYCESNISQEVAKVWAEKLEKVFHSHGVVLRLKEKALTSDDPSAGDNSESLLNLYLTESAANPTDTTRWIKLLQLYTKLGRIEEAYSTAVEAESKRLHCRSLPWYRCLVELLEEYTHVKGVKGLDAVYHRHYITALDSLTALNIEQSHDTADSVSALWSLDRALKKYGCDSGNISSPGASSTVRDEWRVLLCEIEAQYWLHSATILLNKARKERLSWREATDLAAACLLVSYSVTTPDLSSAWFSRLAQREQGFYRLLYESACHRLSQAGHMLNNLLKNHLMDGNNERWMERIREEYCHQQGRDRLFSILYTLPQHREAKDSSYLCNSALVTSFHPIIPLQSQLKEFDQVSIESRPDDLQLAVWIALQYYTVMDKTQPYQELPMFAGLQYDVTNLQTASPESLSQLDIRAFLLATVRCAALRHEQRKQRFDAYRPHLLPVSINERLCTDIQADWWTSVYQLNNNSARENMGRLRAILQRGIETVRLCGAHGMDVDLIVHLALNFTEQMDAVRADLDDNTTIDSPELLRVQARALHYWNHAVQLLEKYDRSKSQSMPKVRLFEPVEGCEVLSETDVQRYLNEGRLFQAVQARDAGNYERAIQLFSLISTPDAAFLLAMTYKTLGIREQTIAASPRGSGELDETTRTRQRALLNKSRAALCTTLDRLAGDRYHALNGRVAEEIDEVESRLRSLELIEEELHGYTANDSLTNVGLSISRTTLPFSTPGGASSRTTTLMDRMRAGAAVNGGADSLTHSTPVKPSTSGSSNGGYQTVNTPNQTERQRYQPSPDRLDAQMRSMTYSQDSMIKYLREELRDSRANTQALETRVTKLECKVEELTEQLKKLSASHPSTNLPPPPTVLQGTPSHIPPSHAFPPTRMVYPPPLGESYAPSPVHFDPHYTGYYPPGLQKPPPTMMPPQPSYYGYPPGVPGQILPAHLASLRDPSLSARATAGSSQGEYDYYDDEDNEEDEEGYLHDTYTSLAQCVDPKGSTVPPGRSILTGTSRGAVQPPVQPLPAIKPGFFGTGVPIKAAGDATLASLLSGEKESTQGKISLTPASINKLITVGPNKNNCNQTVASNSQTTGAPTQQTSGVSRGAAVPGVTKATTSIIGQPSFVPATTAKTTAASFFPSPVANLSTGLKTPAAAGISSAGVGINVPGTAATGLGIKTPANITTPSTGLNKPIAANTVTGFSSPSFGGSSSIGAGLNTPAGVAKPGTGFSTPMATTASFVPPASGGSLVGLLNQSSVSDDGEGDISNPDPHFEAIVTLPVNVELITGEEDERELFADRTKLYRFCEKQWKERGVGTIKVLYNEGTGKARIVMRRDQVHKVCANHYIRPDMLPELKDPAEKKVLTWRATDISDGEPIIEQFCAKFKTEDVAALFLHKFREAIELINKSGSKTIPAGSNRSQSDEKQPASKAEPVVKSLEQVETGPISTNPVSSAAGKVTVSQVTSVDVKVSATSTVASSPGGKPLLAAAKFGTQPAKESVIASTAGLTSFGGFTFSSPAVIQKSASESASQKGVCKTETSATKAANPFSSFSFKTTPTTQGNAQPGDVVIAAGQTQTTGVDKPLFGQIGGNEGAGNKPVFGQVVGNQSATSQPVFGAAANVQIKSTSTGTATGSSALKSDLPVFGSASGLSFASLAADSSTEKPQGFAVKIPESKVKGNAFENAGQQLFAASSSGDAKKSGKGKKGKGEEDNDEGEGGEVEGEYEPEGDFTPLVSLPEVTVITGEESETKIFGERAKLYRMDPEAKAWKERGIGELKIMKDFNTGLSRIIMRREQVLKLCANHRISPTMKLLPMSTSELSWLWFAQDYAEDDVRMEQLCAKFKNLEQAQQFRDCFEKCVEEADAVLQKDKKRIEVSMRKSEAEKPDIKLNAEKPNMNKEKPGSQSEVKSLGEMFKAGAGEWDCGACYVRNKASAVKCVACDTAAPSAKNSAAVAAPEFKAPAPMAPGQQSLSALFKKQDGEWDCAACYVKNKPDCAKCVACETPKPGAVISEPAISRPDSAVKFGAGGGFTFGGGGVVTNFSTGFGHQAPTTGGFSFGSSPVIKSASAQNLAPEKPAPFSGGFKFGSSGSFTFGAGKSAEDAAQDKENVQPAAGGFRPPGSVPPTFKLGSSPLLVAALTSNSDASQDSNKTTAGFAFGSTAAPAFSLAPKSGATSGVNTTASSNTLFPGAPTNASTPKPTIGTNKFNFSACSSPAANLFSTSMKLDSGDGRTAGGEGPQSPQDDSGLYRNSEDDDSQIQFEPVVRLPEKVDLTTGEEDEDLVYEARAKLYRYVEGAWKERGVGMVRLLKRRVEGAGGRVGQMRLVMRRDQVLKLCLNQLVTADTVLHEMNNSEGKAWTWHGSDYSEGQLSHENFAIKFKTSEIASDFKNAVDRARPGREESANESRIEQETIDGAGEIEIVRVEMPDSSLIELARKFLLPDTFFNYLSRSQPCKGCIGCEQNEHKFVFHTEKSTGGLRSATLASSSSELAPPQGSTFESASGPALASSSNIFTDSGSSTTQSLFGGVTNLPVFNSQSAFGSKPVFGSQPVFGVAQSGANAPVFGVAKPGANPPVFGMTPSANSQSLFGVPRSTTNQPVFGVTPTQNQPVFGVAKPASSQPVFDAGNASNRSFSSLSSGVKPVFGVAKLQQEQQKTPTNVESSKQSLFTEFSFSKAEQVSSSSTAEPSGSSKAESLGESTTVLLDAVESTSAKSTSVANLTKSAGSSSQQQPDELKSGERSGGGEERVGIQAHEEDVNVEDDDDDDDERPVFCKRATLFYVTEDKSKQRKGLVDVRITEDIDVGGYRIQMYSDSGEIFCSHIICRSYALDRVDKRSCEWKANDFRTDEARETVFYVEFSSPHATNDFEKCFKQGLMLAQQSDLCVSREDSYYPANGDELQHGDSGGESQ